MPEKKASTKAAASKSSAAAARAEAKGEPKTVEFRGLELSVPTKLPLSMTLRTRKIRKEFQEDELSAAVGILEILLGDGQFEAILAKCDEEGLTFEDDQEEMAGLIEGVMAAAGLGPGESSASANS